MKAVIMQPTYLPWMGYFDLVDQSDVFVFLDDVQFSRQSWQQRNKIKTPRGWQWLTMPVVRDFGQAIRDVCIDNTSDCMSKHWKAIALNYSKAEFFKDYSCEIGKIYESRMEKLLDLNVSIILLIMKFLGLDKKIVFSSHLAVPGAKTEKLVGLCKKLNSNVYLSPLGAEEYIEENNIFIDNGIRLEYHNFTFPRYRQLYGDFIPHMSVLDLLFNEGKASMEIIRSGRGS